jgi:hypothetical protein
MSVNDVGLTVTVTGTNFLSNMTVSDLTINVGTTGLTIDTLVVDNSTTFTLQFLGTVQAGSLTIRANTTAYDNPRPIEPSNILTITAS